MKTAAIVFAFTFAGLPVWAQMNPSGMAKVGTVDARFQSFNVEMVEVIGGRFWKPYGDKPVPARVPGSTPEGMDPGLFEQRIPVDLGDARLRMLAKALGPAYVRVSGTWANTVFFADKGAAPSTPPAGFGGVLTRAEWQGVVDFSKAMDMPIVTSMSSGAGTRDAQGVWQPTEAKKLFAATKEMGGTIAASEFINEPTFPNGAGVPKDYEGAAFGRDFKTFRAFVKETSPETLVAGPGSVGEGADMGPTSGTHRMKMLHSEELLEGMGRDSVDVFSYHFYGAVSERCGGTTKPADALNEQWLGKTATVEEFYAKLRDRFDPGKPIWLTETGEAACGGDRWAKTFADSLRYLDQLGRLARLHVQVVMHNTLDASDYGLIDERTLTPRPTYWAALLWSRTMGATVLDPGGENSGTLAMYAHCMKGRPGGVSVLALNLSPTEARTVEAPEAGMRYTLTASALTSGSVELNGRQLALTEDGKMPEVAGVATEKGSVRLPAESITFLTFADAGNAACR